MADPASARKQARGVRHALKCNGLFDRARNTIKRRKIAGVCTLQSRIHKVRFASREVKTLGNHCVEHWVNRHYFSDMSVDHLA